MARVTVDEVRVIFPGDALEVPDDSISTHIDMANSFVTDELGSAELSTQRLKDIERYITGHLLAIRYPNLGMVKAEWVASEAKIEFSSDFGKMLKSTHYGQWAITLDTTGTLEKLGSSTARFTVFG